MTLDKESIKKIIPHRGPILLADTAEIQDSECVTSYYVDPDMDVLKGHFPDGAVFPGAYILEAMAQCADILLLSDISSPEVKLQFPSGRISAEGKPLLFSVQNLRFLRQVHPGATLKCRAVYSNTRSSSDGFDENVFSGLHEIKVSSSVDGQNVARGVIVIRLI